MAQELRRIASDRKIPVADLCDVSDRTLRTWSSEGEKPPRKKSSGGPEA